MIYRHVLCSKGCLQTLYTRDRGNEWCVCVSVCSGISAGVFDRDDDDDDGDGGYKITFCDLLKDRIYLQKDVFK